MLGNLATTNTDQHLLHVKFKVIDFVWTTMPKECISVIGYSNLKAKKIALVQIVEKLNPNAYRLQLPSHIRTADVFNVKHLVPYYGYSSDDDNLRANSIQPRGDDVGL